MSTNIQHIPIIDSHLHLWDLNQLSYPWLRDVPAIEKTFSIADYQQQTSGYAIEKMVFVQCECLPAQSMAEVEFVMGEAQKDSRISAIVAYAALEKGVGIEQVLATYQQNPLVKGVRRMYDDRPDICIEEDFIAAVRLLPDYGLSMDLSIKPSSVPQTIKLIESCPDTQFILDHLGKPDIKNKGFDQFENDLAKLASFPNVVAKLSGLITEADWTSWTKQDLEQYIVYATGCFAPDRLMFGGDWPVVNLAGTFSEWINTLLQCLPHYSEQGFQMLFNGTASRIYRI